MNPMDLKTIPDSQIETVLQKIEKSKQHENAPTTYFSSNPAHLKTSLSILHYFSNKILIFQIQ